MARLLLDAHLSPRRIAEPLRLEGHDVLALAEERELDGLVDAQVLELAVDGKRILVTCNGRDFSPLLRVWAEERRHHTGCMLQWGFRHDRIGSILRFVRDALAQHPRPSDWADRVVAP